MIVNEIRTTKRKVYGVSILLVCFIAKFDAVNDDYVYHPKIGNKVDDEDKLYENWAGFEQLTHLYSFRNVVEILYHRIFEFIIIQSLLLLVANQAIYDEFILLGADEANQIEYARHF